MQETQVQSLDQEDPLEKEMDTTLVYLPGEPHGQRSLVVYCPWGRKELDMTEIPEHMNTCILIIYGRYPFFFFFSTLNSPKTAVADGFRVGKIFYLLAWQATIFFCPQLTKYKD